MLGFQLSKPIQWLSMSCILRPRIKRHTQKMQTVTYHFRWIISLERGDGRESKENLARRTIRETSNEGHHRRLTQWWRPSPPQEIYHPTLDAFHPRFQSSYISLVWVYIPPRPPRYRRLSFFTHTGYLEQALNQNTLSSSSMRAAGGLEIGAQGGHVRLLRELRAWQEGEPKFRWKCKAVWICRWVVRVESKMLMVMPIPGCLRHGSSLIISSTAWSRPLSGKSLDLYIPIFSLQGRKRYISPPCQPA